MKTHGLLFAVIAVLLLNSVGCTGFRAGAFIGLNPVGVLCGNVLTIKDGQHYRYLSDEKDGIEDNVTTYMVKPVGTIHENVKFGIRPIPIHGMYVHRIEWRRGVGDRWHRVGYHEHGDNPYAFAVSRQSIGATQVELRIIYRYAVLVPSEIEGTVVVGSEMPDPYVVLDQDIVHRYLIPVTFVSRYCDLRRH